MLENFILWKTKDFILSRLKKIVTVPNIYSFAFLKQITRDNILDFDNLIYSENGGYVFDKKTF